MSWPVAQWLEPPAGNQGLHPGRPLWEATNPCLSPHPTLTSQWERASGEIKKQTNIRPLYHSCLAPLPRPVPLQMKVYASCCPWRPARVSPVHLWVRVTFPPGPEPHGLLPPRGGAGRSTRGRRPVRPPATRRRRPLSPAPGGPTERLHRKPEVTHAEGTSGCAMAQEAIGPPPEETLSLWKR